MVRLKKAKHLLKMTWFNNVSVKIDNNQENDAAIEVTVDLIQIWYENHLNIFISKKDIQDFIHNAPDLLTLRVQQCKLALMVQIRFPSEQSKAHFLELALGDRNEDSGNSSPSLSTSSSLSSSSS